jgi:hypothetical protein
MRTLKILLLLVALISFSDMINAQNFKVVSYEDSTSSLQKLQEYKVDALGTKIKLEFYGNEVKVIMDGPKEDDKEVAVFTKVSDNVYQFRETANASPITLTLNKIIKYIKGGTITFPERRAKITFERDGIF